MNDLISEVRVAPVGAPAMLEVEAYERLLAASPQRSIYCNRWWLEAVAPGNWRILTVALAGGTDLAAAWPIVTSGTADSRYVQMPGMSQKLGILFAPMTTKYAENLSRQHTLIAQLIDQLPRFSSFEHSFHESFTNWLPFAWRGFRQTTRYTYRLDEIENFDAVWHGMRTAARTEIRKAARNALTVRDDMELEQFISLNDQTYDRQGLEPPIPHETIRRVDRALRTNAGRKILSAHDPAGAVHAAVYVAWYGGTAYYLMAGSEPALRKSGALYLLMWEAIRFSSTVAERFDFEGSMISRVEAVFRDLGGHQHSYFVITRDPPPSTLAGDVRRLAGGLRRRFRRYFGA